MKNLIFTLVIGLAITLQSCTKQDDDFNSSNSGVKQDNQNGSNYFVAAGPNKPWRKWSQALQKCINVQENCYPEDVIVQGIDFNSLTSAIQNNEVISFFEDSNNVGIFLPNDQLGSDIRNELITGNYDVYVHEVDSTEAYIFYGQTPVSSSSFEYVFPTIIQ
jgi:hypothetical protein